MRVLQVLAESNAGISNYVRLLCDLLAEQGDQVSVAQPDTNPPIPNAAVTVITLPTSRVILKLRELAGGVDVIHAHGLRAGALAALALRGAPAASRPRLIVTLHNKVVGSWSTRKIGSILLGIICKRADVVFGVSADLVELARQRGARTAQEALVAAPPALQSSKPRAEVRAEFSLPEGTDPLCYLTVARLAPQKGLNLLVEAARQLQAGGGARFIWLVAGDGPLRAELEQAAQGVPVRFLGRRDDVGDLLKAADIVVSTSLWEGQQISLQEALQVGAPIVATNVGGIPEVVGQAGMLVAPDATEIATALATLSGDPARREALSQAARKRSASLATPAQMLAQINTAYSDSSI